MRGQSGVDGNNLFFMRNGLVGRSPGLGGGGSRLKDFGNEVIRSRIISEEKNRIGGAGRRGSSYLGVSSMLHQKSVNTQVMNWISV